MDELKTAREALKKVHALLMRDYAAIPTSGEAVTKDVRDTFLEVCEAIAALDRLEPRVIEPLPEGCIWRGCRIEQKIMKEGDDCSFKYFEAETPIKAISKIGE